MPIEFNKWDDVAKQPKAIGANSLVCGENRYLGVDNILEFNMPPGCEIKVEPKDQIMTKIRLDWTLNEFYASGGTTNFVDRFASSLGIHPSTIKVVTVL